MKHFGIISLILLIVIPLVFWLGHWLLERRHYETTDDAYVKANSVVVLNEKM